jgi:uncharacterized protein
MKRLFFLVTMMAMLNFSQAQSVTGTNAYPKTINVTGSADMEIVPDEIYVQVDLKEFKRKGESKTDLEKIKSDFLAKCKSAGIPDSLISIASYEGTNYNYWLLRRTKKNPDMFAGIAYQIKFHDSKKMDQLVELLDDEATADFRIVKISHSKIKEYRKQLKIQAIKAAKDKGEYLTEAINEKMGAAVSIVEPDEDQFNVYANEQLSQYSNAMLRANTANDSDAVGGGVDFKKIKLRYEVKIVFALQ